MIKIYKFLFKIAVALIKLKLGLKEHNIEVDGYKISYFTRIRGKENTLFLVHGLNDSKETWLELIKALDGVFDIVAIDLLGCGSSSKPINFDYSLRSQAKFFQKCFNAIKERHNLSSINLLGHSMGGGIVMLAQKELELKRLILLAPLAINTKEPYIQKLAKELGSVDRVPFLNVCSRKNLDSLIDILYYKKPKISNFIKDIFVEQKCKEAKFEAKKIYDLIDRESIEYKEDLSEVTKSIIIPTLIFWGDRDRVLDVANAKVLGELIKNCEVVIFKECGHMIQIEVTVELVKSLNYLIFKS